MEDLASRFDVLTRGNIRASIASAALPRDGLLAFYRQALETSQRTPRKTGGMSAFLRAMGAVVWKDLAAELRSRELLSSMLVFALLVILIFNFALELDAVYPRQRHLRACCGSPLSLPGRWA